MRKITQESINAFLNRDNFKKANMHVWSGYECSPQLVTKLFLHNNLIAEMNHYGTIKISNAGWFSNTTKERLNGLPNVNINQKNFIWYLNGKEWNGDWIKI